MAALDPAILKLLIILGIVFLSLIVLYFVLLLVFCIPWVQRQSLYAHNIHTAWWHNLDDPETFGFARNQVTAFHIRSPDGGTLYAWHILPRALYAKHEKALLNEKLGKRNEFEGKLAYKLLVNDPESRLIINFHGNAGHLLQNQRAYLYASLTSLHPTTHFLAFSYRGFPRSTGSPNESGVISDGVIVVAFALTALRIPASRIALVGESLGTAVASAVAAHFGAKANNDRSVPEMTPLLRYLNSEAPVDFGCVVLVSSFYDLHTLLPTYRIAGCVPILSPLSWIPPLQKLFLFQVRETWDTKGRLAALVASALQGDSSRKVNIQLIHAVDDSDIPCGLSKKSYEHVRKAAIDANARDGEVVEYEDDRDGSMWKWSQWGNVRIDMRIVRTGGHNRLTSDSEVAVAIMKGLGLVHN